ncbi:spore coat protein [Paenibacillus tritici]|uniref:Spore coat protein n=1 Tax=Paenibacillus tritici TaxID=1873425 RepID=A0ABX2DSN4_9BACL|nr:spore coat protein [Paenibacillus tritici]NQX46574.1 spore coat protein [Paenibacillus tritici]QUL54946.1 spore coat protein [Paenibacillus tritici]
MNPIVEHMTGLNTLTDDVIAMDLLMNAKSGVRNYAMAVTECATPEVREILMKQLGEAITSHEKITEYMLQRGLYRPYHIPEQVQLDLQNIQTAMDIPS